MTERPPTQQEQVALQRSIADQNLDALRISAIIGYTIVPGFWALDVLVLPEKMWVFGGMRLAAALCCVAVHITLIRRPDIILRWLGFLSQFLALLVAWSIEFMVFSLGGYDSPYYAGLLLVVMTIGFLFAWPLKTALLFNGLVYIPYIAPVFLGARPYESLEVAVANHVFLLCTMVISSVSQQFTFRLRTAEILGRLRVERIREDLEQANAQLQQADRIKNEFFSNITHELRTPLTMILSPLDVLLQDEGSELDPTQRASLQLMWRNAIKLLRLIETLLDLSRIEERFLRLRIEQDDLTELVREIVEHTQPLAARKELTVTFVTQRTADDLWVDREKLERVIVNLFSNALKFTEPGGRVDVRLWADETKVFLEVADNGIGIAPDAQRLVFERFRQADGGTTRRYGGTGIGLSFAREIARLHGGEITLQSALGVGSTFTLELPRGRAHLPDDLIDRRRADRPVVDNQRADAREPKEWARALATRADVRFVDIDEATERRLMERGDDRLKATRVLVVEDNIELLKFIHTQLQGEHAVYLAANGKLGLELIDRERPDVLVTDYMMPEMDGIALIEAVRARPGLQDLPIILLTAKSDPAARVRGRTAGADAYLAKPFSPAELRTTIRQLLEKRGRQATTLMAAQAQSLELISAGLAHEIHNPLSYIRNAQHMIARDADAIVSAAAALDDPARDALEKPLRRVHQMVEIAGTGIARIEAIVALVRRYARDGYPQSAVPIAFDAMVEDVLRFIVPKAGQAVALEPQLGTDGAQVEGRADELQQVARNLIQNAVDAVSEQGGGWVRVRTRVVDGQVRLTVHDNGPGISPENIQRIFTPFFSTKAGGDGMGLGLAICHQVVLAHGGLISVDSEPGQGAKFDVRLPLHAG